MDWVWWGLWRSENVDQRAQMPSNSSGAAVWEFRPGATRSVHFPKRLGIQICI